MVHLEVELASHPLYEHIVVQITKFNNAIRNQNTRKKLIDAFYDEIRNNIHIKYKLESKRITKELYKFLSDTINKDPEVIIVIDEQTMELDEVSQSLPVPTTVLRFETYERERVGVGVHIHSFDTLKDYKIKEEILSPGAEKETEEITTTGKKRIEITLTNYFESIDYGKEIRINDNILNRKELWKVFIEKKQMTVDEFKKLSHFKSKAIAGFFKFLENNGIASRIEDTFILSEEVIPSISKLLEKGIPVHIEEENFFEFMNEHKQQQIQKYILNKTNLWRVFIEKGTSTLEDFKKLSNFKPKSIGGFTHFLLSNGIAGRAGDTFYLSDKVIPSIKKLIESTKNN